MNYEKNKTTQSERLYLKVSTFLISAFCSLITGLCFLTFVFCFMASESRSAQIHHLDDLKVIEVPISQTGLTRIAVKGDRIADVFGLPGEYVMEADETQGQVFIRPLEPALNPISITITTEGGHTQDLTLMPKNQAPEALILKAEDIDGAEQNAPQITRNEIEELLYACAEGRIPVGYKSVPVKITSDWPYRLMAELTNNKLRCLTYEIKNWATIPWILSEEGFAQKLDIDVIAVLIPNKLLKSGERTRVYVATQSL